MLWWLALARGKAFGSRAGLSEGTVFRWLALKKAVFGSRVLVRAKSQSSVMVARYGENTAFESRV